VKRPLVYAGALVVLWLFSAAMLALGVDAARAEWPEFGVRPALLLGWVVVAAASSVGVGTATVRAIGGDL
jgi:NADH:ubiquinone oxidoreductase subunit 6 (subunit J)